MQIYVYKQNIITRKQIYMRSLNDILTLLQPYIIWQKDNGQTMLNNETFVDVEYNFNTMLANYVCIVDGVDTMFYFVNDAKQIATGVLRLFLTLDTLTTFYRPNTAFVNGYVKKTNSSLYVNTAKTLSVDEVTTPKKFELLQEFSEINTAGCVLVTFEVTSGKEHIGEILTAQIIGGTSNLEEFIFRLSTVDRVNIDNSTSETPNIVLRHLYVLPSILMPYDSTTNKGTPIAFYPKGDKWSAANGVVYLDSVYVGNKKVQTYQFEVRPENDYRIGTYSAYAEYNAPSFVGALEFSLIAYYNLHTLRVVVEIYGVEYDITSGFELPLIDAVQTLENSQRRVNAVIANALSLLGQGATAAGSFATGNYLAGTLSVGNIANNAAQLYNFSNQRIAGGTLSQENTGLFNISHGFLVGAQVAKPISNTQNQVIASKGYRMLEKYDTAKMESGLYYEIVADSVDIPLRFEQDFLQRLSNGVYIAL